MKRTLLATLIVLAAACGGSDSASGRVGEVWPDEFRDGFMEGCEVTPDFEPYCVCTIDELQETFSLEEFIRVSLALDAGEELDSDARNRMEAAIAVCLDRLE